MPGPKQALRQKNMLTPQEFAEFVGVSKVRVYKWIQRGHLRVLQFGPDSRPFYLVAKSEAESIQHLLT